MKRRSSTQATLGALLLLGLQAVAGADSLQAVWMSQDIRFIYRSQQTLYQCETLAHKVASVLRSVGAHPRTSIRFDRCNIVQVPGAAGSQLATMRIHLLSPAPATAEARAALAKTLARAELLERLGAQRAPSDEFLAAWRTVDVVEHSQADLVSADCELLEQLNAQVLSKLAIRVLESDRSCSSSPHRLRKPVLKLLALTPLPQADALDRLSSSAP